MKAVILAGGQGTRLRPLTQGMPKPLVPLVGKPLIRHIIDPLPPEVEQVVLAVNYRSDDLQAYFDSVDIGREVILVDEPEPLGTGGALKNLSRSLDDTFLALNGDVLSSLDVGGMVSDHRRYGGIGTMALWRVSDPSAYGVVSLDGERVTSFQEKPAPGEELSDLINAGIYVFEPEILDHIPDGVVSLERDVFPEVIGLGLYGKRFEGHWMDCGTRESYLRAQKRILQAEGHGNVYKEGASVAPDADIADTAVLRKASVGPKAFIRNSIICPGARVAAGEKVVDTIFR